MISSTFMGAVQPPPPPHILAGMILFCVVVVVAYLFPTIVAIFGRHPVAVGIAVLNIVLGWTVIGWVAAFVWACIKPNKQVVVIQQAMPPPPTPVAIPPLPGKPSLENELEALQRLKERQLITEDEYRAKRRTILDSL